VESEVLPLAVHGTAKVNDRLYNVVTKGGLVGMWKHSMTLSTT